MKFSAVTVILLLATPVASAFLFAKPHRGETTTLFGFDQGYQRNLEELTQIRKIEVNGELVTWFDVQQEKDKDYQEAKQKRAQAQERIDAIKGQISENEKEHQDTVKALTAEIKKQQEEMAVGLIEVTEEIIQAKLEARKEAVAVVEEYDDKRQQLQQEMDGLQAKLEAEKQQVHVYQNIPENSLATRNGIDQELGLLKKQYDADSKDWLDKLESEQLAQAEAVVMRLREKIKAIQKERRSLRSRIKRTWKGMTGE